MAQPSPLHQELEDLIKRLSHIAQEWPARLVWLTEVVSPNQLQHDQRVQLLEKMLGELPVLLSSTPADRLESLVQQPPVDAVPLRLLLDLRQLPALLRGLTDIRLIQIKHHLPPGGSAHNHLAFLKKLQGFFLSHQTDQQLQNLAAETTKIQPNLQRSKLLQLQIPPVIVNFIQVLLSWTPADLISFKNWILNLSENQCILLVNLLTGETDTLSDLRFRLTDQGPSKRSWVDAIGFDSLSMSGGRPPNSKMQRISSSDPLSSFNPFSMQEDFTYGGLEFEEQLPFSIEGEASDSQFFFGLGPELDLNNLDPLRNSPHTFFKIEPSNNMLTESTEFMNMLGDNPPLQHPQQGIHHSPQDPSQHAYPIAPVTNQMNNMQISGPQPPPQFFAVPTQPPPRAQQRPQPSSPVLPNSVDPLKPNINSPPPMIPAQVHLFPFFISSN